MKVSTLERIIQALESARVQFLVAGGVAVNAYVEHLLMIAAARDEAQGK